VGRVERFVTNWVEGKMMRDGGRSVGGKGKGGNPCLLLIYFSSGYVLYIHFNMVSVVLPERYTDKVEA
jgi:hypothetical protein